MATTPFALQPRLVAISGLYTNRRLIADAVLPRVSTGGTQTFKYLLHAMEDGFTIPDTRVGRASRPAQVQFSAVETSGATMDYGLDIPIPNADVQNAQGQHDPAAQAATDPQAKATLLSTSLLMLDREVRVANLIFTLGTYLAANRTTLSGTSQWSDFTNSNPLDAILTAMDIPVQRPNIGVIGRQAFTKLQQHPIIVSAVLGNAGSRGAVAAEAIANLLGLDQLLVGEGFLNTARPGQTLSMSRVWGKHLALLYIDPNGGPMDMPSFGWTAEWGTRQAGTVPDPNMGVRGGEAVRVYESVAEVISAPALGYFFQNAVA
ncbi:MAG: phage capsid protein [Roseococcus sp.]